jgi:hypothetical protein
LSREHQSDESPSAQPNAYGREGDFFICSTCGRSFPISEIQGQCRCGRKFCKDCSTSEFCSDPTCEWIICKYCRAVGPDSKVYHKVCLPKHILKGCLIVTACYGSPASNEVQYLRTVRDTKILKTSSGKRLMEFLEGIYYYFSPQASIFFKNHEESCKIVRRLVVYPFLKNLYISDTISRKVKNKDLQLLIMSWLTLINSYLFVLWNLFPQKRKNLKHNV